MQLEPIAYADPARLLLECFADFAAPVRSNVADWAAEHRWLNNPGGGYSGRWQHETVPYLVEPMQALAGTEFLTVAVAGPGQSAKTSIAENWLLQSVAEDPGNVLWYMQTDGAVEAYVKSRIVPMIEAHEVVKARLGTQPSDDTLHFKRFRGMHVEFLSAVANNLINKSAPRLVVDEIDAYPESLGDVMALLNIRRQTFGRQSKILAVSHPDRAGGLDPKKWQAGIMQVYADSDRRTWWWACPHCGGYSSPNPGTSRFMALDWKGEGTLDQVEESASLICPVNGCVIAERDRIGMNASGRWLGLGEVMDERGTITGSRRRSDTAGFWIVGVMSPFLLGGIGGLARAMAKAEREMEVTGEENSLREVTVKQLGVPYEPRRRGTALEAQTLADRADPRLRRGEVPAEARVLTVQADTQINRFEVLWRAHGADGESWIVDHRRIAAQPATDPGCWLDLLRAMLVPLPITGQPGRFLRPRCVVFDSGGEDGVTSRAFAAWKQARRLGMARLAGQVRGADAWTLLPSKGGSTLNAPRVQVTYPDSSGRADRRSGTRGEAPQLLFNPNLLKDDAQLALATVAGPVLHLPAWLGESQADAWEQLTAEARGPSGKWEPKSRGQPNELWDLLVLSEAARRLHGIDRILWTNPPAWAADLMENSMVTIEAAEMPAALPAPAVAVVSAEMVVGPGGAMALPSRGDAWAAIRRANGVA